jgi:hypothetical protein
MKILFRLALVFLVLAIGSGAPLVLGGNPSAAQSTGKTDDFVLSFAKVFLSPAKGIEVEEKKNLVRETQVSHGDFNAPDKVTGKCVLEYTWSDPPGRFSSKSLDKILATSSIAAKETSGEWAVRPEQIGMNMYFFKAGDKELLASVVAGKLADVSPYKMLELKIMSLLPDQYPRIEEIVTEKNQAKWLPFRRSWKGQMMLFTPRDYPRAALIVKLKGLYVDGYACYVYEYDPQGTKSPIRK